MTDRTPLADPFEEQPKQRTHDPKAAAIEEQLLNKFRALEKEAAALKAEQYAGPTLTYSHTTTDGDRAAQRIDLEPLTNPRERALCRALLTHALALLDANEPTRTTGVSHR